MAAPDRTLKLSVEEIETIQAALSVAEKVYTDLYQNAIKYSNAQGLASQKKRQEEAQPFYKVACKFSDLNQLIYNTDKDIKP